MVQKRGMHTINAGAKREVVNLTWKVGTVFRETSLRRCVFQTKYHEEGCC